MSHQVGNLIHRKYRVYPKRGERWSKYVQNVQMHARYVYRQPRNRPNVATNSICLYITAMYIYIYIIIYITPTNHYTIHLEPKKTYNFQKLASSFHTSELTQRNPSSLHGVGRISPSSTQARRRTW